MDTKSTKYFGRKNKNGSIDLIDSESGEAVTQLCDCTVWPVGSNLSACYDHPDGIKITLDDAEKLGIEIES